MWSPQKDRRGRGSPGDFPARGAGHPLRTMERAAGAVYPGDGDGIPAVMLLPEEPAGKISTRTAGMVEFRAELSWRFPDDVPSDRILAGLGCGNVRFSVAETDGPDGASRDISCELRAFTDEELRVAMDEALRAVTVAAALCEAVLETCASRLACPSVTPLQVLEMLACETWRAGFGVHFGPSWSPVHGADVGLGVRGGNGEVEAFLAEHPSWKIVGPR